MTNADSPHTVDPSDFQQRGAVQDFLYAAAQEGLAGVAVAAVVSGAKVAIVKVTQTPSGKHVADD